MCAVSILYVATLSNLKIKSDFVIKYTNHSNHIISYFLYFQFCYVRIKIMQGHSKKKKVKICLYSK